MPKQFADKRSASKQIALEFARHYFVCGVASQAAEAVGVKPQNARVYGKRYLARQDVQDYLADARKKADVKVYATKERILEELSRIAFGDMRKLVSWGPGGVIFLESSTLSPEDASTVEEVSQGSDGQYGRGAVKIKKSSKVEALKLLGMEHGMFQKNAVGSKENPLCVAQPVVLSGDSEV